METQQHDLVHCILIIKLYVAIASLLAAVLPDLLIYFCHVSKLREILLKIKIRNVVSEAEVTSAALVLTTFRYVVSYFIIRILGSAL